MLKSTESASVVEQSSHEQPTTVEILVTSAVALVIFLVGYLIFFDQPGLL